MSCRIDEFIALTGYDDARFRISVTRFADGLHVVLWCDDHPSLWEVLS